MAKITCTVARASSAEDLLFVKDLVARAHAGGELWALSWNERAVESEIKAAETWIAADNSRRRLRFLTLRGPGHAWEITLVAVASEFKGSGVFQALLAAIRQRIAESLAHGGGASSAERVMEIDLEVRADNTAAIRAYEKNGFSEVRRRKAYYSDGMDAIQYRFKL